MIDWKRIHAFNGTPEKNLSAIQLERYKEAVGSFYTNAIQISVCVFRIPDFSTYQGYRRPLAHLTRLVYNESHADICYTTCAGHVVWGFSAILAFEEDTDTNTSQRMGLELIM